jgi:uncharacterized protein with GYD domain
MREGSYGQKFRYRYHNLRCSRWPSLTVGLLILPKEKKMPTYIALLKWTEKGIAGVKGSPARLDAGRAAFKAAGINMTDVYMTMGRYDLICVLEAPNDETLAKGMLTLGSDGNVSTETLKAFTEAEYRKILGSL